MSNSVVDRLENIALYGGQASWQDVKDTLAHIADQRAEIKTLREHLDTLMTRCGEKDAQKAYMSKLVDERDARIKELSVLLHGFLQEAKMRACADG